jgi:hypothetical protein
MDLEVMVFTPLEKTGKIFACENTVASMMLTASRASDLFDRPRDLRHLQGVLGIPYFRATPLAGEPDSDPMINAFACKSVIK